MTLLYSVLQKTLREAGVVLRRFSKRRFSITHKGPIDIVTSADHAAERKIFTLLRRRFQNHGFLMEESGARVSRSGYRWIVDPLDGTVNFAHGLPISCVSIGLEREGRLLMGGVYDPFREELFLAVKGRGTTLNGRPIRVSITCRLIDAVIATGFPYKQKKGARYDLSFVERFMKRTQGLRRLGATALDMAYVACGRFDGCWEFDVKPWDVAAGALLVEEAGGQITDFHGRPYLLTDTSQTLCSNRHLHRDMLRVLGF